MNIKNLKIEKWKNEILPGLVVYSGFTTYYDYGIIQKTEFESKSGAITFYLRNQEKYTIIPEVTVIDMPYIAHYGITVTEDGKYFLVQNHEKGLYCFEVKTGVMVWYIKGKQAGHLIVRNDKIICCFEKDIRTLSLLSGDLISRYPLGNCGRFYPIADNIFLVGPKRGKYFVFDSQFNEVYKFPIALLNPDNLDTIIIQNVEIKSNVLVVSGVAYSSRSFAMARKNHSLDKMIQESYFTRHVEMCGVVMDLP